MWGLLGNRSRGWDFFPRRDKGAKGRLKIVCKIFEDILGKNNDISARLDFLKTQNKNLELDVEESSPIIAIEYNGMRHTTKSVEILGTKIDITKKD